MRQASDSHHIRQKEPVFGSDKRDIERGLEVGLVETRERAASVRRLELRHRRIHDTAIVRGHISSVVEATHLVVQVTGE